MKFIATNNILLRFLFWDVNAHYRESMIPILIPERIETHEYQHSSAYILYSCAIIDLFKRVLIRT